MSEVILNQSIKEKTSSRRLLLCVFLDLIGYLSYLIPFLGEFTDAFWAPISAFIAVRLFKGAVGKVSGIFSFIEEIMPGLDFIPTFTLTWIYVNVFKK